MKYCKKCESLKALADFHANRRRKDGLALYCKACDKVRKAEYRKQNKAKVDARYKAWAQANPEVVREANRAWRERNKEKVAARQKARYEKNREAVRHARRALYEKNAEAARLATQAWTQANPHKVLASRAKRRSAKLLRTPGWLTAEDFKAIELIYAQAKALEASTGLPHHVDHIYPLQGRYVSGLHVPANLQVLTASENCSKSNMWVPDAAVWGISIGQTPGLQHVGVLI